MNDAPPQRVLDIASEGAAATCTALAGMSGGAWLVEVPGGPRRVVRNVSGHEAMATNAADAAGVGPAVLSLVEGWMVTEWVEGRPATTLELRRPLVLDAVAALLRRWHDCGAELPAASMQQVRVDYAAAAGRPLAAWLEVANEVERSLPAAPSVPAHLDVVANLLVTDRGLRLIDFEYAAMATVEQELGQVAWESELGPRQVDRLVEAYWGQAVGADRRAAVTAWTWMSGVTWTAWAAGRPGLATYRRRSWERLVGHWSLPGDLLAQHLADDRQAGSDT